jgi:hypothetical protein
MYQFHSRIIPTQWEYNIYVCIYIVTYIYILFLIDGLKPPALVLMKFQ